MPRQARIVIPNLPHHCTQRGNRRQIVFFNDSDRRYYLDCLKKYAVKFKVFVLAYCLMRNHVHHVLVPSTKDGLHKLLKTVHTKYAFRINKRFSWSGHLWQARFFSSPLDQTFFLAALRYVEINPVRAKIVAKAVDYKWSSAKAHVLGVRDDIIDKRNSWNNKLPNMQDWQAYLSSLDTEKEKILRLHHQQNLPCGSPVFIKKLEVELHRTLIYRSQCRPEKGDRPL